MYFELGTIVSWLLPSYCIYMKNEVNITYLCSIHACYNEKEPKNIYN